MLSPCGVWDTSNHLEKKQTLARRRHMLATTRSHVLDEVNIGDETQPFGLKHWLGSRACRELLLPPLTGCRMSG